MPTIRRLGIGPRLGAGFAFCTVAACVVGVVGLSALKEIEGQGRNLFRHDATSIALAEQVMVSTQETGHDVAQHLYVHNGDATAQNDLAKEVEGDVATDRERLAELGEVLPPDARGAYDEFVATWTKVDGLRTKAMKLSHQETVEGSEDRAASRALYTGAFLTALDAFRAASDQLTSKLDASATARLNANAESASSATWLMGALAAIAMLGAAIVGIVLTRSITRPIDRLRRASEALSVGDVESARRATDGDDDDARDEIARSEAAFNELVSYLQSTSFAASRLADGDTTVEFEPHSEADELGHAMQRMLSSASDMADVAGRIAVGEQGVEAPVRGARDALGNAFRRMIEDLESREVQRTMQARLDEQRAEADRSLLEDLAAMSQQLSSASATSERTAGEVTVGMEEIASSMAELTANAQRQVDVMRTASDSAAQAAEAAAGTTAVVGTGVESVDRASTAMSTLNDSAEHVSGAISELAAKSERVGGIVETITAIADQTNLLALNAAIEAARAGEQGRGFAVVADEVRKLAEESQGSAAQIAAIVAEIRAETERTVLAVHESLEHAGEGSRTVAAARTAFLEIEQSVRDVLGRTDEIRTSAEDAVQLAQNASTHTEQVSAATEETAASMQEVSATASELSRLAESLSRTATGESQDAEPAAPRLVVPTEADIDPLTGLATAA